MSLCSSIRKSFGFKYVVRFSTHNTHLSERNLRALRIFLSILWARTKSLNSIFSTYKGETDGWLLHRTYKNALLVFYALSFLLCTADDQQICQIEFVYSKEKCCVNHQRAACNSVKKKLLVRLVSNNSKYLIPNTQSWKFLTKFVHKKIMLAKDWVCPQNLHSKIPSPSGGGLL